MPLYKDRKPDDDKNIVTNIVRPGNMEVPSMKLILFYLSSLTVCVVKSELYPVVLVPGDGGSQFQAKLNKPSTVHYYCDKTSDYYDLWLNVGQLAPFVIDCFVDNMRLVYDPVNHTTHSPPGVEIRIPGFGQTETVEWLDPSHYGVSSYYHTIVENMVSWGYVRNKNVRGAPYDFRKAPNEMGQYFKDLQALIEESYNTNNNTRVVLIGHSMGNPVTLYFLNHMTTEWKAKFIQSFVSLAGVFGGVIKSVSVMVSGDNLNIPVIDPMAVRPEQRSAPSLAWLMPSDEFWGPDEVLVVAPSRNYTVKDYKDFFHDMGFDTGYMMWEDTNKLINPLTAPGVEVHCLHGFNISTSGQLVYTQDTWLKDKPQVIPDDGDGTVNIRSLNGCLRFGNLQDEPVHNVPLKGAEHTKILNDDRTIAYLKSVLLQTKIDRILG